MRTILNNMVSNVKYQKSQFDAQEDNGKKLNLFVAFVRFIIKEVRLSVIYVGSFVLLYKKGEIYENRKLVWS